MAGSVGSVGSGLRGFLKNPVVPTCGTALPALPDRLHAGGMQKYGTMEGMPSPIGHALGGAIVALAAAPAKADQTDQTDQTNPTNPTNPTDQTYQTYQTYLTWCAVAACLPDIDFLWGRHSMETHSLFV